MVASADGGHGASCTYGHTTNNSKSGIPHRPGLTPEKVKQLLTTQWCLNDCNIELKILPSYDDLNFHVIATRKNGAKEEYVFKATKIQTVARLEMQNDVMNLLQSAGVCCSYPVPSKDASRTLLEVEDATGYSATSLCRLLTYLHGSIQDLETEHHDHVLANLGAAVGGVCKALKGYSNPCTEWFNTWDQANTLQVARPKLKFEHNPKRQEIATQFLDLFERVVTPRLPGLRRSVCHGDLSDTNLLWNQAGECVGVLDFGDCILTQTIFEITIVCAYYIMATSDPVGALAKILKSIHNVFPLERAEVECAYVSVACRLVVSVLTSAEYQTVEPNEYTAHTYAPGWRTLERLASVSNEEATKRLLDALSL